MSTVLQLLLILKKTGSQSNPIQSMDRSDPRPTMGHSTERKVEGAEVNTLPE